jgi:hypothetical protein
MIGGDPDPKFIKINVDVPELSEFRKYTYTNKPVEASLNNYN